MASDFDISNAAASAAADATLAVVNGGTLRIYSGVKPATPDDALSGNTLLAQLGFGSPSFGSASNGVATNNVLTSDSNAPATGTAAFFRAYSSGGAAVFQGTCGTSNADLIMSSTAISTGGTVTCDAGALTYTQPRG